MHAVDSSLPTLHVLEANKRHRLRMTSCSGIRIVQYIPVNDKTCGADEEATCQYLRLVLLYTALEMRFDA